jgi:hypothetical protein
MSREKSSEQYTVYCLQLDHVLSFTVNHKLPALSLSMGK